MPQSPRPRQEDGVAAHSPTRLRSSPLIAPSGFTRRRFLAALAGALGVGPRWAHSASAWRPLAPLLAPRQEHAVAYVADRIYVIGGFDRQGRATDTVEAYDPARDRWEGRRPLPAALHHVNAAALSGKLYVVGALGASGFDAVGASYEYDPESDRWTPRSPMPAGTERGASGVAVVGPRIYVAGGLRGTSVGDVSAYEPAGDRWEALPAMPGPRDHLVACAVGEVLFAIGGRGPAVGLSGRADAFDPKSQRWSSRRAMPTPRAGCGAAVVAGRIVVVGGEGNRTRADGIFPEVEAYDPAADSWAALPPMSTPRHGLGAVEIQGKLYAPGGATRAGFGAVATNEVLDLALAR